MDDGTVEESMSEVVCTDENVPLDDRSGASRLRLFCEVGLVRFYEK